MKFKIKAIPKSRKDTLTLNDGISAAKKGMMNLAFLALIKAIAGFMTGTVVLLADAVNTLSDVLSLSASYVGLSLSKKKAKKNFRYGYYKVESFAAFIVALLTLYLAYQIFLKSLGRFDSLYKIQYPWIGVGVCFISILSAVRLSKKLGRVGMLINSPSLKNNAQDRLIGILASVAVIGGIVASYFGIYFVEGIIGIAMSALIFIMGYKSARDSFFFLLDYWDNPELLKEIGAIAKKHDKIVTDIKNIRLRRSGPVIFGEIIVRINPFASSKEIRTVIDNMDKDVRDLNPYIKDLVIYTMIPKPSKIRVAVPIKRNLGMNSKIAKSFAETKNYIFVDVVNNKSKYHKVEKFKFKEEEYAQISEFLEHHKTNILIAPDLHSLVYFDLNSQSCFDLYPSFRNVEDVKSIVKLLVLDS